MKLRFLIVLFPLLSLFLSIFAFAEETRQTRSLAVLPTTDITDLHLAEALQTALGQLAQDSGMFSVELGSQPIPGFTREDVTASFQSVNTELMSFVYSEPTRISVFLFDSGQSGSYLVGSEELGEPEPGQPYNEYLEGKFRAAWATVISDYVKGVFQPLPGADRSQDVAANDEASYKAAQARLLFRELASIEEQKYYAGAHVGMTRYSALGASNSTVNFGGTLGMKVANRFNMELGNDIFSYWLLNLTGSYHLPLAEKYVSLRATLGGSRVMATITENRGFASSNLPVGQLLFGPGISFEIPLLGAHLRGDLKYYVGGANILIGSYGIVYSL